MQNQAGLGPSGTGLEAGEIHAVVVGQRPVRWKALFKRLAAQGVGNREEQLALQLQPSAGQDVAHP